MRILRAWRIGVEGTALEEETLIDEDRASRELANAHGDKAIEKLRAEKTLSTRFAVYRIEPA